MNFMIDGVIHISTNEAARWLGVATETLQGSADYKRELEAVKVGGSLWWPKDKVLEHDRRKFDRRYKNG